VGEQTIEPSGTSRPGIESGREAFEGETMRFRGVHHVEFAVLNYDESIPFYDKMFGWLGYTSFWTLGVEYVGTYYMARLPWFHSYIGIQPAQTGGPIDWETQPTGINHIALWARSKKEVDRFYQGFLIREEVSVTHSPAAYPQYAPGYYAVFFLDPCGIRWELAYTPRIPMPWDVWATIKAAKAIRKEHPEWQKHPLALMMRKLPSRSERVS
jgi:catechol 2,3-dioxygenase-like lactoylglutathione lyase family enzyme